MLPLLQVVRQRIGSTCRSKSIPANTLDALVWAGLVELLRHPERVAKVLRRAAGGCWLPQELQARRDNLRRGRSSLAQQVERLTEAYLSGVVPLPEYQRRREELERRDDALSKQADLLDAEASRTTGVGWLTASAQTFAERVRQDLDTATFELRRKLVELLIDRVGV